MNLLNGRTDHELIQLFKSGDLYALQTLLSRHQDKIYTSIFFLVKDKYLAEDILQDVFVKVIDTLRNGRYSEEGKFLPWVIRIAHNLCVDHFRKVKRTPVIRSGDNTDLMESLNGKEPCAGDYIEKRQSHDKVRRMLDELPVDQREVIILRHYAGLSFKEIASLTDCSINTCLGRMRYGLINLRKMVTQNSIVL